MTGTTQTATSNAVGTKDAQQNPLVALAAEGQSVWLDYITRDLVRGGELRRLIEEDGLRGLTSNPTIFAKAIGAGDAYDAQIKGLVAQGKDLPPLAPVEPEALTGPSGMAKASFKPVREPAGLRRLTPKEEGT